MASLVSETRATPLTLEQIRHLADQVFLAAFNAPTGMNPEGVLVYRHAEGAPAAIDMLRRMERALIRELGMQAPDSHPNLSDVQAALPLFEGRLASTCQSLERMQYHAGNDEECDRQLDRLIERRETLEWVLESLKAPAPLREARIEAEAALA